MRNYFKYLCLVALITAPAITYADSYCELFMKMQLKSIRSIVAHFRQNEYQISPELATYIRANHQSRIALYANGIEVVCSEKSIWGRVYLGQRMKQEFLRKVQEEGLLDL